MNAVRIAWAVGLAALIALPFVYRDPYHLHILVLILIWSFAYTSWSIMGRFGLVSLGHGGFMGVGAYVTALLWNHLGVSPWIGIPAQHGGGGGAGAHRRLSLLPLPHHRPLFRAGDAGAVRHRAAGHHRDARLHRRLARLHAEPRPRAASLLALQFDDKTTWYLIALFVWVLGLLIWRWVDRSMSRYAMEAISEDEDAAAAAGVNVTAEKLKITLISAR